MESTKENAKKKKTRLSLSAFTIIILMIYVLAIISHLLPSAQFDGEAIIDGTPINDDANITGITPAAFILIGMKL